MLDNLYMYVLFIVDALERIRIETEDSRCETLEMMSSFQASFNQNLKCY